MSLAQIKLLTVTICVYMHGFPEALFEMSARENDKIWITIVRLLFVTYLQYLPLNICFQSYKSYYLDTKLVLFSKDLESQDCW